MITVVEDFLSEDELALARDVMKESTFVDGARTAGYRARRVKNNEQVSWSQSVVREFQDHMLERIHSHPRMSAICLPRRVSRPLVSRSREGMGYGLHVDDAQIGESGEKNRSDISMTLFLSHPDEYEGGELEILTPYGASAFKLPAGQAIAYPSRFLHQVRTVTSGERVVAICWMESHVRDEQEREILAELDAVCRKLHGLAPDAPETDLAFKARANLLRRWVA